MISKIVLAVVAAVIAYLVCIVVGSLLVALAIPIAVVIGGLFKEFAGIVSVLVFLVYAFTGATLPTLRR